MTTDIAAVLVILVVAIVLFIIEKPRMDVVALLVMATLGVTGLVTPTEALAGFSNPAVITVWAMFILSAGLSAAGVADALGRRLLRVSGKSEPRMIATIMLAGGGLSAFMNNIGVAALMLPVVMDLARKTGVSPSRLLIPLAYGTLLGGLTTLVGTPPNLVAAAALGSAGYEPFSLFDFTPVGLAAMLGGTLFMVLIGRHLLPRSTSGPASIEEDDKTAGTRFDYGLADTRFTLRVRKDFPREGRTLDQLGLGSLLGFTIYEIHRDEESIVNPDAATVVRAGDELLAHGQLQQLRSFLALPAFDIGPPQDMRELLRSRKIDIASIELAADSGLGGLTLNEADFRNRFGPHVLAIVRDGKRIHRNLAAATLHDGDQLVVQAPHDTLSELAALPEFRNLRELDVAELESALPQDERILELQLGADASAAVGKTVAESDLIRAMELRVIGIARPDGGVLLPDAKELLREGDILLVQGKRQILAQLQDLAFFEIEQTESAAAPEDTEGRNATAGTVEVTLAPESGLLNKTLRDLNFRSRYGLTALAIWRKGKVYRFYLRNFTLNLGDALLLSGPPDSIARLTRDPDFLILSQVVGDAPTPRARAAAITAIAIMAAVVGTVLAGLLPIAIAAVSGAALMVALGCLTMKDAYRAIDWKSVFLIACMIPLGTAMQTSGAAKFLASYVISVAEPLGPWGLIAGLYAIVALATTIVPTAALVMIMAPIAMGSAVKMGMSPHTAMMAVAMAASASFTSPISHPANVLVMGPGGYRFIDYVKTGLCLAIVVFLLVIPAIALFWPPGG